MDFPSEYWPEAESKVEFMPSNKAPDMPVTAVKVFIFQGQTLLLAKITNRGWDLPGGHIEPGETELEAIARELYEETGAEAEEYQLIGYFKITKLYKNEFNKRYPDFSCILVFKGRGIKLDKNHHFPSTESEAAQFFKLSELKDFHHNWNETKRLIAEYAVKLP